jgi:DNA helicase-2/ATP-dependent DNA helicase PcrA
VITSLDRANDLTPDQRRIVEWGDGPVVVIAGAGTGKTRVIVERVRHLLETGEDLLPEQILVLTYNVKAARELRDRLDATVGATVRGRIAVSNFHSFCHRILTENAGDAGLPERPDVLDGVGQALLLRDILPDLPLLYHTRSNWAINSFVGFINRAKDELVGPGKFDAFVDEERRAFEALYGSFENATARLLAQGNLEPFRRVRRDYAAIRASERAQGGDDSGGETPDQDQDAAAKTADREARRTIAGTGYAQSRGHFAAEDHPRIDTLATTYVADGAALEVLRWTELAAVFRAYEVELARRGALDYGEQIAGVTTLFKTRPNILRRWQRQYRYILVDEFQDANVAQIELIELLGRTPDRPDNVMVVGDDDQSIYRFRGASFAAFAEFDARFSRPPIHDPTATPPGPPPRLRIEQNFRSVGNVLTAANRLIGNNETRFEPGKRLTTDRPDGDPVELVVCAGAEDEAVAIVDAIKSMVGPGQGSGARPRWTDVAVLYRKHRHRDAIVGRLRDEDIPYTVVGGLSLFETPEIRDLEQSLRAIADPHDDAALVRMMTAGPWRLDALEILRVTRTAKLDRAHLLETVQSIVASGQVEVDVVNERREDGPERESVDAPAVTRAKVRQLIAALNELNPLTFREGPHTILERFLERTGSVLDLIAADTLESKRTVTNIASFMRFAADWQAENPGGTLAGFVAYLDAYQAAGGELPTSVELSEDVEGVRLMTLYQAKGLEFPIVFVPCLLDGEWPVREGGDGLFPRELLREAVPAGDIHTDEERRLLYVAMTRAQERLILTTHGGAAAQKEASRFVGEITDGAGLEIRVIDRTGSQEPVVTPENVFALEPDAEEVAGAARAAAAQVAAVRRVMPLPTARERRLALRLRASELVGLMEATSGADPEAVVAREAFEGELAGLARSAATTADEARAQGLDPLTFRSIALDDGLGANLLQIAPLPDRHSYSSLRVYDTCPLKYAFQYVYRMPPPDRPVAAFAFGTTAHAAFEAFTKERRERAARGEPPPSRADLETAFRANWTPTEFGDKATEEGYQRRVATLLDNFWNGEVSNLSEALHEELDFELTLDAGDDDASVIINGTIDRIDRLPSGGIEVLDYKTGRAWGQKAVDESLQLSIYALACRDALGLGTPERVTLYFTESALRLSTTRTDEQLDLARAEVLARVSRMRAGEFAATPSADACRYCDWRAMCPERV